MKHSTTSAVALSAALFFSAFSPSTTPSAYAMDMQHARAQKDLTPALQQSLQDMLSEVSGPYFDAEEAKKAKNQKYLDLQQKFEYLPTYGPHGALVVSCKLGGVEYDPTKPGTAKGSPTGMLKYLVFTYALQNKKWVSVAKPKWEEQDLGPEGRKKMTEGLQRGEARKAAIEKTQKTHAAAAAAAAAAQKAADQH
jgi:hypothetical protein